MSVNRKRASELLQSITFGESPIVKRELVRCYQGHWLAKLTVVNELLSTPRGPWVGGRNKGEEMTLTVAFNYDGHYIGLPDTARHLEERGIAPVLRSPDKTVCSIGKSSKDGKWYGWSHRAIAGFQAGDRVEKGHATQDVFPVGFEATSDEDARALAEAFADSVA